MRPYVEPAPLLRSLLLGTAVAACAPAIDASRLATSPPLPSLSITPRVAQVWSSDARVSGASPRPLLSCSARSNGAPAAVRIEGLEWSASVPVAFGDNIVDVRCRDVDGREHRAPAASLRGMLRPPRHRSATTAGRAARDAVVYGVVPPFFGAPPLRAVTEALPRLADLGVDVLWLSPIFENAPRDFGYAVVDYQRVRRDYGTEEDLRTLVDEAHRRGLRVVLDFVPNHTSIHHPYFAETRALGRMSHYWSFYVRDADGRPEHYLDWEHLPNLDFDNVEVKRWMLENARRWMQDASIDGYRIDAAWGVRRRSPTFFDDFVREVRAEDSRALLFAEASPSDPYYRETGFDATYDWTESEGEWSWQHVFEDRGAIVDRLDAAVGRNPGGVLRFLENNDTGARFVTRYGPDVTRAAAAALFTLPGIPLLFTGQEHGAEYEPYTQSAPLFVADRQRLSEHYRRLIALRHEVPALRSDVYARLETEPREGQVFAFRRGEGEERALVAIRFEQRAGRVRLVLPAESRRVVRFRDALTGETFRAAHGVLDFPLAPWATRVLLPVAEAQAARNKPRD